MSALSGSVTFLGEAIGGVTSGCRLIVNNVVFASAFHPPTFEMLDKAEYKVAPLKSRDREDRCQALLHVTAVT